MTDRQQEHPLDAPLLFYAVQVIKDAAERDTLPDGLRDALTDALGHADCVSRKRADHLEEVARAHRNRADYLDGEADREAARAERYRDALKRIVERGAVYGSGAPGEYLEGFSDGMDWAVGIAQAALDGEGSHE